MGRINEVAEYKKRFQSILEYTQMSGLLPEAETEEPSNDMPSPDGGMGEDPMAGGAPEGGMGAPMGENPMAGGAPEGGMDDGMGEDPMAGGAPEDSEQGVEGLNPNMDGDDMPEAGDDAPEDDDVEEMEDDDEVIDVDQLTGYQRKTAQGVGKISDEIKDLKKLIMLFQDKVEANQIGIDNLKKEIEKRAPNAEEKITLRQQKSGPFTQTIEGYWEDNAPENYKVSSDDEVDNPKYTITKSDVDGITDWNNISKSFDELADLNDLRNIFDI